MFRTVPLSIIRSFITVHTAMVYVIQVLLTACEQDQDGTGSILIHTPDDGRGIVRNMYSSNPKINLRC